MAVGQLLRKNRSYRRYDERVEVPLPLVGRWLEDLTLLPSARNLQPLRYVVVRTREVLEALFPLLGWAGYLKGKGTPPKGERPTLYVVIGYDKRLTTNPWIDVGIAAQSLLLMATEKGYGGCMIGSFSEEAVRVLLGMEEWFGVALVVALGKPKEKIVIVPARGSIEYYRDEKQIHYVPKRGVGEVWLKTL